MTVRFFSEHFPFSISSDSVNVLHAPGAVVVVAVTYLPICVRQILYLQVEHKETGLY